MSVEKLDLKEGSQWLRVKHIDQGCFTIAIQDGLEVKEIGLARSQAHLLMLYLQEHLNGSQVSNELDQAITDEIKNKPKDIMG